MRTHTHQFQRQTHFSTMIVIRKRRIVANIEIQHIENKLWHDLAKTSFSLNFLKEEDAFLN